jgi:hypothetical protein
MLKCSKRNYLKRLVLCFGHLKLGPRPQGGESEGPILKFEFVSDFEAALLPG